jgi:hypothetical protein
MKEKISFDSVFNELRSIIKPYEAKLQVIADSKTEYCLNTNYKMENKQQLFFASVNKVKAYVSFHLMPVYVFPDLLKNISGGLKKRMQGKSCFNFKTVDEKLFEELSILTEEGFNRYKEKKMV